MRASLSLLAVLTLSPLAARAQDETPPPPPTAESTLSVQVHVVALEALVRDHNGLLVHGLTKSDFTLREDGKPIDIRYFDADSDLPLRLGLMVDTSGSQLPYADEERKASAVFLQSMLKQPQDQAFLVRFDSRVLQLQALTPSVPRLTHALDFLTLKESELAAHIPAAAAAVKPHGGTLLFDAICFTAYGVTSKQPGRRAIVVLTDGDDNGSTYSLSEAIRQAQLADTAVYSVMYTSQALTGVSSAHPYGVDVMRQISQATGGRIFVVSPQLPIAKIFQQIEEDMRSQYRFGFTPAPSKPLQFHMLDLKTVDKTMTLQTRTGYYSPSETPPAATPTTVK